MKKISNIILFLCLLNMLQIGAMEQTTTPLQEAVIRGDYEATKALLERVDVNEPASYTKALHHAVLHGHETIVQLLLSAGADIDARPISPLSLAILKDHESIAQRLLASNASINMVGDFGETPLFCASLVGNLAMVLQLLKLGANPQTCPASPICAAILMDKQHELCEYMQRQEAWQTDALHRLLTDDFNHITDRIFAASEGLWSKIREYLMAGVCEDTKESINIYLARCECKNDLIKQEIIRTLIEHKASLVFGKYSMNPLCVAAAIGCASSVRTLLAAGAPCDAHLETEPLVYAAYGGHTNVVEQLINSKASLDSGKPTALEAAIYNRQAGVVRQLLQAGASVIYNFDDGRPTLLHLAAEANCPEITRLLLCANAATGIRIKIPKDKNVKQMYGWIGHRSETCSLPQEYAYKLGDNGYMSTLIHMRQQLFESVNTRKYYRVAALLRRGCDSILTDEHGNTIAHLAAINGDYPLARVLMLHGIDFTAKNNKGQTPVAINNAVALWFCHTFYAMT